MLKLLETLDAIADPELLESMGWIINGGTLQPGMGRLGSAALRFGNWTSFIPPPLATGTTRLVLGIAVLHPEGGSGGGSNNNGNAWMTFNFRSGEFVNFTITARFNRLQSGWGGNHADNDYSELIVTMCTGSAGTGYPAIVVPAVTIPTPYSNADFTFLELFVDVADYTAGTVKVAVNGRTYLNLTGIYTAAFDGFGNDPYDPRAKLTEVSVSMSATNGYYSGGFPWFIDTIYLCNAEAGYQNDFLGPIFSKTFYPVGQGSKSNWIPYVNSTYFEDGKHEDRVNQIYTGGDETQYLEADQDLVDETFTFEQNMLPVDSTLVSVNHRTVFRNVASPGTPIGNGLAPLFKIAGNPMIATNSLTKRLPGWLYSFLDVYYSLVPGFAIPWTEYLLEQSEFGFLLKEAQWTTVQLVEISFADELIEDIVPEVTADGMDMVEDVADSATPAAIWWVLIEDDLCAESEVADYYYPAEESLLAMAENVLCLSICQFDVCEGGTASALNYLDGTTLPENAFDGNPGTTYHSDYVGGGAAWLQYERSSLSYVPAFYRIHQSGAWSPTEWQLQGWNEVTERWDTLDTRTGISLPGGSWSTFSISGVTNAYGKFRFYVEHCMYVTFAGLEIWTLITDEQ